MCADRGLLVYILLSLKGMKYSDELIQKDISYIIGLKLFVLVHSYVRRLAISSIDIKDPILINVCVEVEKENTMRKEQFGLKQV